LLVVTICKERPALVEGQHGVADQFILEARAAGALDAAFAIQEDQVAQWDVIEFLPDQPPAGLPDLRQRRASVRYKI